MSVDNCESTSAEPPGFIDPKSAGEAHELPFTCVAGEREVHIRMIG